VLWFVMFPVVWTNVQYELVESVLATVIVFNDGRHILC
jgi:hypothetical protein